MGVFYDIYGLLRERNLEILTKFISHYVDLDKVNERLGDEIMLFYGGDATKDENFKWIKLESFNDMINYGLNNLNSCYSLYLDSKENFIENVIITFTLDSKLILGLCIDADYESKDKLKLAELILSDLNKEFNLDNESIQVEVPPANDELEFIFQKHHFDVRK